MDNILLFIGYLIFSLITIELASSILGIYNKDRKIIVISLISGIADYIVKEFIVPNFGLFDEFHLITGMIILTIACYYILEVKVGVAFSISILSYILGFISDVIAIIILVSIFDKDVISTISNNKQLVALVGLLGTTPLFIFLVFTKYKKLQMIKNISLYR